MRRFFAITFGVMAVGLAFILPGVGAQDEQPATLDPKELGGDTVKVGQSPVGGWFSAKLGFGKKRDNYWGVRATGARHQAMGQICGIVVKIPPPDPNVPYFESDETKACGRLATPSDSVSIGVLLRSPGSGVTALLASVYHPVVREVTFVLRSGERKVYRAVTPKIAKRAAKGIPAFRYLIAFIDEGACIDQIITADRSGEVIRGESGEPACPAG